jgi:hypothetical protein
MESAPFTDAAGLYATLGGFFRTLAMAAEGQLIHRVGGPILFVYHVPEARILWVPCVPPGSWPAFRVLLGADAGSEPPLLTFEQDGETAHRFWLGRLDLAQALARQQVRALGPLSRAMKLLPHLDPVYPRYAAFLAGGDERP